MITVRLAANELRRLTTGRDQPAETADGGRGQRRRIG